MVTTKKEKSPLLISCIYLKRKEKKKKRLEKKEKERNSE